MTEETTPNVDLGQAVEENPQLTIGGLSLQSWQVLIWVLAGAVFCGILLALVAAYVNYRKERMQIHPEPTYKEGSVAMQRERLLSAIKAVDYVEALTKRQQLRSITHDQFLASRRAGRRPALAGSSMLVEAGSFWQNPQLGSMRSGVTSVSTPQLSDNEENLVKRNRKTSVNKYRQDTDSLIVELGDMGFDDKSSVASGLSLVQTPMGSVLSSDYSPRN